MTWGPGKTELPPKPLSEILVEGSGYPTGKLKKRLLREGVLSEECSECGSGPVWNGKPLTLQLDHTNGVSDDHRLENLRILCPNCHTQTLTYAGRNKPPAPTKVPCEGCGGLKPYRKSRPLCRSCSRKALHARNSPYPPDSELQALLQVNSLAELGGLWDRSPQAIGRYCARRGIETPSAGRKRK